MNYYEINDFISIQVDELIFSFNNGDTITGGCVSVFEDSIGKPGDRLVELKKIFKEKDELVFEFGNNEKILVKNPSHIVVNDKVIGIQNCDTVKWITNDLTLKYQYVDSELKTDAVIGEHFFRSKQNSASFLLYTW